MLVVEWKWWRDETGKRKSTGELLLLHPYTYKALYLSL